MLPHVHDAQASDPTVSRNCGYFQHLSNWTHSWTSVTLAVPGQVVYVKLRRTGGRLIFKATVKPASSGAWVTSMGADGSVVIAVPGADMTIPRPDDSCLDGSCLMAFIRDVTVCSSVGR